LHSGSTLFWEGVGHDDLSIDAAGLDESSGLGIAVHIFVADKGAYYDISDSVPQVKDGTFAVPWS
jgi:hypothetical protein